MLTQNIVGRWKSLASNHGPSKCSIFTGQWEDNPINDVLLEISCIFFWKAKVNHQYFDGLYHPFMVYYWDSLLLLKLSIKNSPCLVFHMRKLSHPATPLKRNSLTSEHYHPLACPEQWSWADGGPWHRYQVFRVHMSKIRSEWDPQV